MTYSSAMPVLYPVGFLLLLVTYVSDKYTLLNSMS